MYRLMQRVGKMCATVTLSLVILAASAGKATAQFPAYGGGGMAVGYGGFGYGYPMMGYGYGMGGYGYPMMGAGYGMGGYGFPGMGYGMGGYGPYGRLWHGLRNGLWHGWAAMEWGLWHGLRNGRLRIRLSWLLWKRLHASDVRHRTYPVGHAKLHDRDSALWTAVGTIARFRFTTLLSLQR